MKKSKIGVFLLGGIILAAQWSCSLPGNSPSGGGPAGGSSSARAPMFKPGVNLFSPQQDIQMGQQSAQQIERQMPIVRPDDPIVGYIRQLGAKLAAKAPGEKFPYQFNVVGTRDINAFALPGGFIFVNAGAIAAAKNEGELAGVMAHEIMHVALRHGTNQATKAYLAKAGLGVLGGIAGAGGAPDLASIINVIGGAGANMLFLKFGRTAETQSDLEGARIMAEAGYDPRDMASFFQTLQRQGGQGVPEFMSDHPDPGNRVQAINEIYKKLPVASSPIRTTQEFEAAKARVTGRPSQFASNEDLRRVGPRDSERIEPGSKPAPPSSSMRDFQASDGSFALQFPDNWDGLDAGSSNYIFAPKGAYAKQSESLLVTHGIFIGVLPSQGGDLGAKTTAFVQQQLEGNPDFRLARQPQQIDFGGRPGYVTVVAGPSTTTGVLEYDVTYTTLTSDGRFFYLITIVPENEAEQYKGAFERIISTLRLR